MEGALMKALIRISCFALLGVFLALSAGAKGEKTAVVWPVGEIKWLDSTAMKGLSTATLWGDPSKGANAELKKVAAGTDFGWHTHSSDHKILAISGTFDFQLEGGQVQKLGPGSYVFVPANMKHTGKCNEASECMYFEESAGKSDFIPAN
jgi:quercetin dioxygenase-like cupin family protein